MLAIVAALLVSLSSCGDLCSSEAIQVYQRLNALAASNRYADERAAFLVRDNGTLHAVLWASGEGNGATHSGRIPLGCIAVVHTHPLAAPQPSRQDVSEAQRLQLPIVVITADSVSVANPDGSLQLLLSGRWRR